MSEYFAFNNFVQLLKANTSKGILFKKWSERTLRKQSRFKTTIFEDFDEKNFRNGLQSKISIAKVL